MPTLTTAVRNTEVIENIEKRFQPADRQQLGEWIRELTCSTLESCVDEKAAPVALTLAGQSIQARPIDTRRFVRAMAPHICFN